VHAGEFAIGVVDVPRRREDTVGGEHAVVRTHDEQALNLRQSRRHRLQPVMQFRTPREPLGVARVAEQIDHAHEKHFVGVEHLQGVLARDADGRLQRLLSLVEGLPIE
jgi:hypothetical protein